MEYGINLFPESLGVPRALSIPRAWLDRWKDKYELEPYNPRKHNTKIIVMEELQ